MSALAEAWYIDAENRSLSPSTLASYRYQLDRQILPSIGRLKVREISVGLVDRHLTSIKAKQGSATAKTCRSILSGMCSFAGRRDLMDHNPLREVSRISVKPQKVAVTMDVDEIVRLRNRLINDHQSVSRDLPDLIGFLAGTGCRIGEALALSWSDVDLDAATIEVKGTVLRVKGQGPAHKTITKDGSRSTCGRVADVGCQDASRPIGEI